MANANDAILVTEAEPVEEPGPRIVYANESFSRMTGYSSEEIIGKTPRVLQSPDTEPEALDRIRSALHRWRPIRVELLNQRKDGAEFWVELNIVPAADENGWYTHWVSIQRDTTERRREEEERRRQERRFRDFLLKNASDIAAVLETDGTVRFVAPSVARVLGYDVEDLRGSKIVDYVHPQDLKNLWITFQRATSNVGVNRPVEFRARHADSFWRHLEAVSNNLLDEPAVRGIVVNAWDITARKRSEEVLSEIREVERRKVARDLHDGVLQEIIDALYAAQLDQIKAGERVEDDAKGRADEMGRQVCFLQRAVEELRKAIYNLNRGNVQQQSFVHLLESLAVAARQKVPGLALELEIDESCRPQVPQDTGCRSQVPQDTGVEVVRIVHEALVNVRRHASAHHSRVSLRIIQGRFRTEVTDDGVGFDPEKVLPGMGIESMRQRALLVGGKLEIQSKPGQGTRVTVEVPMGPDHKN